MAGFLTFLWVFLLPRHEALISSSNRAFGGTASGIPLPARISYRTGRISVHAYRHIQAMLLQSRILTNMDSTTWDIDPHTQAKHQILEEYLKRWFPIVSGTSERVVCLDGFAGPGVYSNGEYGSPVIAIRTAMDHKHADKFKEIFFWFIEKDQRRAENLELVLKDTFPTALPSNLQYEIEKSEFGSSLEKALDAIEGRGAKLVPTFVFIDPFGFSGMPMSLISRMLGYKKCEVLITFMSSFINRFNDEMREDALDRLFGSEDWREIRKKSEPDERRRFIVDFYAKQLREDAGAKFYKTFEMVGKNNQIVYHLVFATKSIEGPKAMKEAMFKVDRRGTFRFSDRTDPAQAFLVDYSDEVNWMKQASSLVHAEFAGKTIRLDKVEEFVLVKTPFVFRREILKRLERENKITNVGGRKKSSRFPTDAP